MRTVRLALRRPGTTLALAAVPAGRRAGRLWQVRPRRRVLPRASSPTTARCIVHARGNLSLDEKDRLVARGRGAGARSRRPQDRLHPRRRAAARLERDHRGHDRRDPVRVRRLAARARRRTRSWTAIRAKTADIPGILVEVTAPRAGPPTGKPIQVQLGALDPDALPAAAKKVAAILAPAPDIRDLDDGLPLPGIDWKIDVDKAEAAKYGASAATVGTAVQLVTNGVKVDRIPPGRQRQGGRHHRALPGGPPQPRPDRRTARADAGRLGADRQFRRARRRRRASATSTASPATA